MAHASDTLAHARTELTSFSHPRYFYGQRLDVRHFEGEQDYFKRKLWLLNRLVHGYGVVCGLDVQPGEDRHSIVVLPGVALDRHGHEIVVPSCSEPVAVPECEATEEPKDATRDKEQTSQTERYPHRDPECDEYVQVLLCFHTCDADPEPVLAGGCDAPSPCAAGSTRERYRIVVREGKAPPIRFEGAPDLLIGNRLDYAAIARWVSQPCVCNADPCIPLANVKRPSPGCDLESSDIDIGIRPVVFTLDLLFQVIAAVTGETHNRRGGKY